MSCSESEENDELDEQEFECEEELKLTYFEEDIKSLIHLFTISNYRWLNGVSAYTMVSAVKSPVYRFDRIREYMTEEELNEFVSCYYGSNSNVAMNTLMDFIFEVLHVCEATPSLKLCLSFLSEVIPIRLMKCNKSIPTTLRNLPDNKFNTVKHIMLKNN